MRQEFKLTVNLCTSLVNCSKHACALHSDKNTRNNNSNNNNTLKQQ